MGIFIVEFNLADRTRSPVTVKNGDVIVDKGYSTVTVRNIEADSDINADGQARLKAEAFLNELCWRYGINLEIGNGWTVMLQDSPTTRHIKYFVLKVGVRGGHRRKYPRTLKEIVIKPSDSKALYRKASISQDPRDKFREFFLVIENIASKIVRDWSNETELIKGALQICFSSRLHELEQFVQSYSFIYDRDVIDGVSSELYGNYRTKLFHAKAKRNKQIPFNPEDERKVQRILPLAEFVAKSLISYEDTNLLP